MIYYIILFSWVDDEQIYHKAAAAFFQHTLFLSRVDDEKDFSHLPSKNLVSTLG